MVVEGAVSSFEVVLVASTVVFGIASDVFPNNVQALMSRSDIANILTDCLKGVTTKSGIPARTPRYQVLNGGYDEYGGLGQMDGSELLLSSSL